MIPKLNDNGNLPEGVHWADWQEFVDSYGFNDIRMQMINGLKLALDSLKAAGCETVYVDGSFVTTKEIPGDYDACWEISGVDVQLIDSVLLEFDDGRATQKAKFGGEMFPNSVEASTGLKFSDFFRRSRQGDPKGIIALDLRRLP